MFAALIEGGIKLYVPDAYLHTPEGPQGECPTGSCNSTGCTDAYEREGGYPGEPSWVCKAGADLFLETCKLMIDWKKYTEQTLTNNLRHRESWREDLFRKGSKCFRTSPPSHSRSLYPTSSAASSCSL